MRHHQRLGTLRIFRLWEAQPWCLWGITPKWRRLIITDDHCKEGKRPLHRLSLHNGVAMVQQWRQSSGTCQIHCGAVAVSASWFAHNHRKPIFWSRHWALLQLRHIPLPLPAVVPGTGCSLYIHNIDPKTRLCRTILPQAIIVRVVVFIHSPFLFCDYFIRKII